LADIIELDESTHFIGRINLNIVDYGNFLLSDTQLKNVKIHDNNGNLKYPLYQWLRNTLEHINTTKYNLYTLRTLNQDGVCRGIHGWGVLVSFDTVFSIIILRTPRDALSEIIPDALFTN
jgi:hypothetical protein